MLDAITPTLTGMVGSYILVFLVPIVGAVGIGLVVLGFMKGKAGLIVGGLAFPLAVLGFALYLRQSALSDEFAVPTLEPSMNALGSFVPYSFAIAITLFLVTVVPAIARTARR